MSQSQGMARPPLTACCGERFAGIEGGASGIVPADRFEPDAALEQMILAQAGDQVTGKLALRGNVAGRGQEDPQGNRRCHRVAIGCNLLRAAYCGFLTRMPSGAWASDR